MALGVLHSSNDTLSLSFFLSRVLTFIVEGIRQSRTLENRSAGIEFWAWATLHLLPVQPFCVFLFFFLIFLLLLYINFGEF